MTEAELRAVKRYLDEQVAKAEVRLERCLWAEQDARRDPVSDWEARIQKELNNG